MRKRFPEIFQLTFEEKFQLAQELWADIADHHEDEIPTPDWVWEELERRHAAYLANPTDVYTSIEEVVQDIQARYARETDNPAAGQTGPR